MSIYIYESDVEHLLEEVVNITGETKAEAVRNALQERYQRLSTPGNKKRDMDRLVTFLENEVWLHVPPEYLGNSFTKEEEEEILGFGDYDS